MQYKTEEDHHADYESDDGERITVTFYQEYVGTDRFGHFEWSKTGNLNPKSGDREITGNIETLTDLYTGKVFKKIAS